MTTLARSALATLAFSMAAFFAASCAGVAQPSGSGGTSSSATASDGGGGATTSGSSSTISTTGSGTSSSSGTGIPCVALKDAAAPNPTPGACQGNVAVTCGQDGFLTEETCASGSTCTTYSLDEWSFDASATWVPGRKITWAGCKPDTATACALAWNSHFYDATNPPHCAGIDRIDCRLPSTPSFTSSPSLTYGTKHGWLITTPCAATERCAGGSVGSLVCIDASTPACDGTEPFCSPQGIVTCNGTWESLPGYRAVESCGAGQCYGGTQGPFCGPSGEVACDAATFGPPRCEADGASTVQCFNGFTTHGSCATCADEHGQIVPCRCDMQLRETGWSWIIGSSLTCTTATEPTCIPQASTECVPGTDADTCVGNVAHRCIGHWQDIDCGPSGLVCGVANGLAGCKAASAPACDPATLPNHCEGGAMVGCCACDRADFIGGPPGPPCVPGFETRSDCKKIAQNMTCKPPPFVGGPLECIF